MKKKRIKKGRGREKKKHNPPGRIRARFDSGETMIPRAGWGFLTFDTDGGKIKGLVRRVKKRLEMIPPCMWKGKKRKKERKKKEKRPNLTNLGNLSPIWH